MSYSSSHDFNLEYEVVRASILHHHPLPILDFAIQEIIYEETCLGLDNSSQNDVPLVTPSSKPP